MADDIAPVARQRTAAEVLARSRVESRFDAAYTMRHAGIVIALAGAGTVLRYGALLPPAGHSFANSFRIGFHGQDGRTHSMSLMVLLGLIAIAAGPIVSLVGQLRVNRAQRMDRASAAPATNADKGRRLH